MYQPVIIKGNHYGLTVFLDPERPFPELMEYLGTKIRDSAGFFRGAKMALSFEGRTLTPEETNQAVNTICENSEIKISCVIDTDKAREDFFRRVLEEEEEKTGGRNQTDGEFYKGTLRSGQMLEAEGSVIMLGDVNPGARITARGNIIVLGAMRGTAIAGLGGNPHAVIVALDLNPIQIRIGDFSERPVRQREHSGPRIAYLDMGRIRMEPLCKEVIDAVDFR